MFALWLIWSYYEYNVSGLLHVHDRSSYYTQHYSTEEFAQLNNSKLEKHKELK